MRVEPLAIAGAVLLVDTPHTDDRGSFRRAFDRGLAQSAGLDADVAQVSVASNADRGTVRGLHYQVEPHSEAKTLWCSAGRVFDVIVDLRPDQPTYGTHCAVELAAGDGVALHVPTGVAHGYQTLVDGSELVYLISAPYVSGSARSLRWNDPHLAIPWPLPVSRISARDEEAPPWPPR